MSEPFRNILPGIARVLGLKPSETARLAAQKQKLEAARAENVDAVDAAMDDIRRLETRAQQLRREFDASHGQTRDVLLRQIQQAFTELDRLKERVSVLCGNIDKISLAQEKIRVLLATEQQGISAEQLDDVGVDMQVAVEVLKNADRAAANLEKDRYDDPARKTAAEAVPRLRQTAPATPAETPLPPAVLERFNELGPEGEKEKS